MNVSFHKCATGDTQFTVYSCYGKVYRKKNKTEQNSKGNATNSKDYLVGGNQHGHKKSKDKLIKVSLRFSSDLIAVSEFKFNLAIGSNPWCLVLKVAFS